MNRRARQQRLLVRRALMLSVIIGVAISAAVLMGCGQGGGAADPVRMNPDLPPPPCTQPQPPRAPDPTARDGHWIA